MGLIPRAVLTCVSLACLFTTLRAQTVAASPAPPPQAASPSTPASAPGAPLPQPDLPAMLSSRAAYDEAMHPLDMTRRSIGNWSDVELAALNLAVQQAASACMLRDAMHLPVSELVDLARLCGVGQKWEITMMAAHRYISAPDADKPQLTQAYADAVEAELRLKMGSAALQTALEMLAKVPYDGVASGAYNQALEYLQFVDTPGAFTLAQAAQPLLLERLKVAPVPAGTPPPGSDATLTSAQVYRDALRLPALEVYRGHFQAADTLAAAVEAAIPVQLAGDDALLIATERRRYALLGHRLPPIDIALSLDQQRAPAQELPLPGLTTVLLLFPDWCAQCVRMGPQFPEGKFTVGGRPAAFYALLAATRPTSREATLGPANKTPAPSSVDLLRGTPTVLVPAATLLQLEATDYPLLLVVDEKGIVRLHEAVGEDALQSGSTMDTAISSLGPTTPASPAGAKAKPANCLAAPGNAHSPVC